MNLWDNGVEHSRSEVQLSLTHTPLPPPPHPSPAQPSHSYLASLGLRTCSVPGTGHGSSRSPCQLGLSWAEGNDKTLNDSGMSIIESDFSLMFRKSRSGWSWAALALLRVGDLGSLTLMVCQIRLLWWFKITFEHSSMALPTRWSLKSPLLEHGPDSSSELNEAEVTVTSESRFHMASVWFFLSLLLSTGVGSFELPWKKVGCPEAAILESDTRGVSPVFRTPIPLRC